MSKHLLGILAACLLSMSVHAAGGSGDDAPVMRVAIGEWPPFVSRHLEHYGLAARIVTEAFAAVGVKVRYRFYPWKRAYLETLQGDQDATAIWTRTPKREGEVLFSDPVLTARKVFFHLKKTDFHWADMSDLEGYTVGATRGYGYGDAFDRAAGNGTIDVEYVNSDKQNFQKLLRGRIDVFPMTKAVGYSILNTEFDSDRAARVTSDPRPVQTAVFHLLFSKAVHGNRFMVKAFNDGLAKLRGRGLIEKYVRESQQGKYIQSD